MRRKSRVVEMQEVQKTELCQKKEIVVGQSDSALDVRFEDAAKMDTTLCCTHPLREKESQSEAVRSE